MRRNKTRVQSNGAVVKAARENHANREAVLATPRVYLIRIADRESMKRAEVVLGEVRVSYCCFADSQFLVANEHLESLLRAAIPFEQLS